jgi:hypothetical protein
MRPTKNLPSCLSLAAVLCFATHCAAQTPAPANNQPFLIPLADSSLATAVILPGPTSLPYLVYATPTGQIGLWTLTPPTNPQPPTPPTPPQPPTPPTPPTPPPVVNIIVVTAATPAAADASISAWVAAHGGTFYAYTVEMVSDDNPPPNSLKWIGRTAGKPYPYAFAADAAGTILWQGPQPKTSAALIEAIETAMKPKTRPACPGGACPLRQRIAGL